MGSVPLRGRAFLARRWPARQLAGIIASRDRGVKDSFSGDWSKKREAIHRGGRGEEAAEAEKPRESARL
jgi:hypothetical protein